MNKTEEFIERARKIHGYTYDYSLVEYVNNKTKIKIICKEHGIFEQTPFGHINRRYGCIECSGLKKYTTVEFIENARKIHGYTYDYSLVEYINMKTKVKIICKKHGVFEQEPSNHINRKCNCPYCSGKKLTTELFILKSNISHKNKYDYSLVKYVDTKTKVKIICQIHGIFEQLPSAHIYKKIGCPDCSGNKSLTTEEFIGKARKTHGDRYDYSLVEYKTSQAKVKIICHIHGIFEQIALNHLNGTGCPVCNSSKGEIQIEKYLQENNIKYIRQKKFEQCKNKQSLPFDFYLPELNICIEYDGEQHYKSIPYWGGDKYLKYIQNNDKIKTKYCKTNNIKLIRIRYDVCGNKLKMIFS